MIIGTRPPPCIASTLTSVDNYRAVLFGGRHPEQGRINDLYLIDFDTMVILPNCNGMCMHFVCIRAYSGFSISPKWSHVRVSRGQQ